MTWYAAHTFYAIQRSDGTGPVSIMENIYLLEAPTDDEVLRKAIEIVEFEKTTFDTTEIDGFPADCVHSGVKLR